jgi:prevent-host-death family protein
MLVNMHDAKTRLSQLVEQVESGHEVIIGRNGHPVARLVPYERPAAPRTSGRWAGRMRIAEGFDSTPVSVIEAFEGRA